MFPLLFATKLAVSTYPTIAIAGGLVAAGLAVGTALETLLERRIPEHLRDQTEPANLRPVRSMGRSVITVVNPGRDEPISEVQIEDSNPIANEADLLANDIRTIRDLQSRMEYLRAAIEEINQDVARREQNNESMTDDARFIMQHINRAITEVEAQLRLDPDELVSTLLGRRSIRSLITMRAQIASINAKLKVLAVIIGATLATNEGIQRLEKGMDACETLTGSRCKLM